MKSWLCNILKYYYEFIIIIKLQNRKYELTIISGFEKSKCTWDLVRTYSNIYLCKQREYIILLMIRSLLIIVIHFQIIYSSKLDIVVIIICSFLLFRLLKLCYHYNIFKCIEIEVMWCRFVVIWLWRMPLSSWGSILKSNNSNNKLQYKKNLFIRKMRCKENYKLQLA